MSDRNELPVPEPSLGRGEGTLDENIAGVAIWRLLDRPLSSDDLREATERVARPPEVADKDIARLLVFQIGDELLACETLQVSQVVLAASVHRIPFRTNKIVRGLCSLGGELLLCADLARLLDLGEQTETAAPATSLRRMIVLGEERNRWVVEVDAVGGVTSVPQSSIRRPAITVDAARERYTKGLAILKGRVAALLDIEQILSGFQGALR